MSHCNVGGRAENTKGQMVPWSNNSSGYIRESREAFASACVGSPPCKMFTNTVVYFVHAERLSNARGWHSHRRSLSDFQLFHLHVWISLGFLKVLGPCLVSFSVVHACAIDLRPRPTPRQRPMCSQWRRPNPRVPAGEGARQCVRTLRLIFWSFQGPSIGLCQQCRLCW